MLRIIAGKYRSLQLDQPDLKITRPTSDRVRESIFNIIQNEIQGSIVLDAFAGSGAMSFEASSRGAMKIIAIEKNKEAFKVLEKNQAKIKTTNIEFINTDIETFLDIKSNIEFDFIFLDPPYQMTNLVENVLQKIKDKKFLKKYGQILLETDIDSNIIIPQGFIVSQERIYGKTKIIFIKNII